jgi:hypothetical protein
MKSTLRFVSIFGERYQLARRQFFMRSKIKFDYPFEFANCFDNHTLRTVKSLPLNADVLLVNSSRNTDCRCAIDSCRL